MASMMAAMAACFPAGSAPANGLLTGLKAAWELNEASGNGVDSIGSSTLTNVNSCGSGSGLVYPNARTFATANTQYFTVADNADIELGDFSYTYEIWLYATSYPTFNIALRKADSGGTLGFVFYYNTGTGKMTHGHQSIGGYSEAACPDSSSLNTWEQYLIGWDKPNNVSFIRKNAGTKGTTAQTTPTDDGSTLALRVGASVDQGLYWDGRIGPLRYWNRLITDADATTLYNGGSGLLLSSFN